MIHNVFCPYVASFLQKYESEKNFVRIEIRSFQQPVSYLWGLDPKYFRISLAFNMIKMMQGLSLGSGDVIVLDLFGCVTGEVKVKDQVLQVSVSVFQLFALLLSSCT